MQSLNNNSTLRTFRPKTVSGIEFVPFQEDYKSGRANKTRSGVIAPDGNKYKTPGEYTATLKRDANPLYDVRQCRDMYALFRIDLESYRSLWVEVHNGKAKTCAQLGFDTQETMHKRMDAEGIELNNAAIESLIELLRKQLR